MQPTIKVSVDDLLSLPRAFNEEGKDFRALGLSQLVFSGHS